MSVESIKFLHLADVHLDRPLYGGRMMLPPAKAKIREREIREVFQQALELGIEEQVELILIAGDLWEEEFLRSETVNFLIDTFSRIKIPIAIVPGNEDSYSAISHYSNNVTFARFGRHWSPNVRIFTKSVFETVDCPPLEGLKLTGIAHRDSESMNLSPLEAHLDLPEGALRIGLLHGTRAGHLPAGRSHPLLFKDPELLSQDFDYVALGHLHEKATIIDDQGHIRAAYPGSLCALEIQSADASGVILGTLSAGGVREDDFRHLALDPRRLTELNFDVSGLPSVQAVENMISEKIQSSGIRNEDLILIELRGEFVTGSRIAFSDRFLNNVYFHMAINTDRVKPVWGEGDKKQLNPETTEAVFQKQMQQRIAEAVSKGDHQELTRLQQAYCYGLDVLYRLPIKPRKL